jgi:predicted acylesterase/phospholipase RssA
MSEPAAGAGTGDVRARRYCDVVMKGGITSGILYPPAVCELARAFYFKSIGGTSAGAIAAAALAAAEYRRRHGSDEGLRLLAGLPNELRAPGALFQLFRPDRSTRRLFRSLERIARADGAWRRAWAVLWRLPLLMAPPWRPRRLLDNGFGLASGMAHDNRAAAEGALPPLGEWLADTIDRLAGKDPSQPLTFGDLWDAPDPIAYGGSGAGRVGIELQMVTTALSHGRPYTLPFIERTFSFKEEEMARLFPRRIVDWMVAHARPLESDDERVAAEGRLGLPEARDLPVVVAARMSLSFPGLFAMVPLYAVDYESEDEQGRAAARVCWFSDGGLSSNFPLHFFDSLSPRWPTFGINLRYTGQSGRPGRKRVRADGIYVPERMSDGIRDLWVSFEEGKGPLSRFVGFAGAILGAAQNWHDNSFLRLPGYRDRVVEIWLDPHEGGLNLDMPPATIEALIERGRAAGALLRERFTAPATLDTEISWDGHRWTRFRSAMAALAVRLQILREDLEHPMPGDVPLRAMLEREDAEPPKNYRFDSRRQREAAIESVARLLELLHGWDELFDDGGTRRGAFVGPPRPEIELGARSSM